MLSEHGCSQQWCPYRLGRRAEQVQATHERVVAAAVRRHLTIGPASTTVSALAEEAGHPADQLLTFLR